MPSTTKKQQRFFRAVLGCKKSGDCKGKLRATADSMSKKQIEDFTKLKEFLEFEADMLAKRA